MYRIGRYSVLQIRRNILFEILPVIQDLQFKCLLHSPYSRKIILKNFDAQRNKEYPIKNLSSIGSPYHDGLDSPRQETFNTVVLDQCVKGNLLQTFKPH